MSIIQKITAVTAIVSVTALSMLGTASAASKFKAETSSVGGSGHGTVVIFAKMANRVGYEIEVNPGKKLTKAMLSAGRGKIGFYTGVPAIKNYMVANTKVYAKVKDAKEAGQKLRAVFGYNSGLYHIIAFEKSGIKTLADIKGKTVYTGVASGSSSISMEALIRATTGYEPNVDYKAVRLSNSEGGQAMMDGKVDVMMRPMQLGAALIQQLGLSKNFRILGVPKDKQNSPGMKKLFSSPGRSLTMVMPNSYKGQVNTEPQAQLGYYGFLGTHAGVDDDVIYEMTKSFWENIEEVRASADYHKQLAFENTFTNINVPLHNGAYRYYKEMGIEVPAHLLPPGIK